MAQSLFATIPVTDTSVTPHANVDLTVDLTKCSIINTGLFDQSGIFWPFSDPAGTYARFVQKIISKRI